MPTQTIAVLGIDAADIELLRRWDCGNLLLSNYGGIETFSYGREYPVTMEIWPSIATGLHPRHHGVSIDPAENRDSNVMKALIKINQLLPDPIAKRIVEIKSEISESPRPQTEAPHVFEDGKVSNWPGVTKCWDYNRAAVWFRELEKGEISEKEFYQLSLGNAGRGIGWLASQSLSDVPISGCHIHILDYMGHIYSERPDRLKRAYLQVDEMVGEIMSLVDELVIISDHGMQTTEIDDHDPGIHSERAFVSSTIEDQLPETMFDVKSWLEKHKRTTSSEDAISAIDTPTEHLKDLGYI